MYFWCVFVLVPLLISAALFFRKPAWLPLAAPLSALVVLAAFWEGFCYYESRPLLAFFLCIQEAAVAAASALLLRAKQVPSRRSRWFLTLASCLFTMMCTVVPCRYFHLRWCSGFPGPHPSPSCAFLLVIPFAAGILLSLAEAWKSRNAK